MTRSPFDAETETVTGGGGLTGRRLVIVSAGGSQVLELPGRGKLTIGRGEDVDVRIEHASVSRRHARLHLDPDLRIEDLGSSNGTRIAGATLSAGAAVPLPVGALVEIGSALLAVHADGAPAADSRRVAPTKADESMVVASPTMQRIHEMLDVAAGSRLSVLLLGETGVGKEVLAARIHRSSPRARGSFIKLNCAALVESLLESELFGHERGAFTGAVQPKAGLLEAADAGTLFLDEIGEMPLPTQAKLLRVLESGEVTRVGSLRPRSVDVRFVAATNRDLEEHVRAGRFRADLFFRLDGVSIRIPPLRERIEEIGPLAEVFLRDACIELNKGALTYTPEALARLRSHVWPGNVRELRNVVQRAALFCKGQSIGPQDLYFEGIGERADIRIGGVDISSAPSPVVGGTLPPGAMPNYAAPAIPGPAPTGGSSADDVERQRILDALKQFGGNQTRAAEVLGVSRRTLINRMIALGLPRPRKA